MFTDARVLIVARDDRVAEPLSQGLDQLGWRTITARGPYAALAAVADLALDAAIIDLESCGLDPEELATRLKDAAKPRSPKRNWSCGARPSQSTASTW